MEGFDDIGGIFVSIWSLQKLQAMLGDKNSSHLVLILSVIEEIGSGDNGRGYLNVNVGVGPAATADES